MELEGNLKWDSITSSEESSPPRPKRGKRLLVASYLVFVAGGMVALASIVLAGLSVQIPGFVSVFVMFVAMVVGALLRRRSDPLYDSDVNPND
jgi:polyferredoxin